MVKLLMKEERICNRAEMQQILWFFLQVTKNHPNQVIDNFKKVDREKVVAAEIIGNLCLTVTG